MLDMIQEMHQIKRTLWDKKQLSITGAEHL